MGNMSSIPCWKHCSICLGLVTNMNSFFKHITMQSFQSQQLPPPTNGGYNIIVRPKWILCLFGRCSENKKYFLSSRFCFMWTGISVNDQWRILVCHVGAFWKSSWRTILNSIWESLWQDSDFQRQAIGNIGRLAAAPRAFKPKFQPLSIVNYWIFLILVNESWLLLTLISWYNSVCQWTTIQYITSNNWHLYLYIYIYT